MATKRAASGQAAKKSAKKPAKKSARAFAAKKGIIEDIDPLPDPLCFSRCADEFALCLANGGSPRDCKRAFTKCVRDCAARPPKRT